jgi:predicted acylesterase/phospholipase RssA
MARKKLGLALGSGAARGFAHIGVLSALERHNLRPDFIAGTSIGAAVGAVYCAGKSPADLCQLSITTEWQDLIDFTVPKSGMIAGKRVEKYISELTGSKRFDELQIPLQVVATDLKGSHRVVLSEGDVARAIRASISIPGIFVPASIGGRELVDGGLVDPVPFDVVREMGAEVIIAVDLSLDLEGCKGRANGGCEHNTFFEYLERKFIKAQVDFFIDSLYKSKHAPEFTKKYMTKVADTVFNPACMSKYVRSREMPRLISISLQSILIMISQLAQEQLKAGKVDCIIRPVFKGNQQMNFDNCLDLIEEGERAALLVIPKIKKLVG